MYDVLKTIRSVVITLALLFIVMLDSREVYAQNKFEILASHTIRPGYCTLDNYRNLEECGFTLSLEIYPSREDALENLKIAQETNVRLILRCPELLSDMENTVRMFNEFSSFGGYYIFDEPGVSSFEKISQTVDKIRSLDSNHYFWINLYPIYAKKDQLEIDSYNYYVRKYLKVVKPDFISFDCYGIKKDRLIPNYYNNLEIISSICKEYNIPFWAYVLTSQFNNFAYPDKGSLSFQAYNNLAYGASVIEYFSYRRVVKASLSMTVSPIDTNYVKMPIYEDVKALNSELQYYAKYFTNSELISVSHLSNTIPDGCKALYEPPNGIKHIKYSGKGFVVSQFRNNYRRLILFVNKDYKHSQKLTLNTTRTVRRISYNSKERGYFSGQITYNVLPGEIVLLRLY